MKNRLEATEPRGVWAGLGRGLELSGLSGAGLGQWTRGIQRQLGYPTWGRDGRDPGSGFALRLTWILCCVWFEMLQDTQGKGRGQVAIGVWDPRGNWGPGYEVGLELALMGSGKGCRPSLGPPGEEQEGVQLRAAKGVAEKVEGVGAIPGPRTQSNLLSSCTLDSRCGHKQRPLSGSTDLRMAGISDPFLG